MSEELNVPISELDPKGIKELASKLPPANDINSRLTQTQRELEMLYSSLQQLQTVQERFIINVSTLTLLRKTETASEALVPLTPTVYVSCRAQPESVLIDIGTGYYLEMKDLEKADAYFVRRVKFLQEQMAMVGGVIDEKQKTAQSLTDALEIHRLAVGVES